MLRCDADCKDAVQEAVLKAWQKRHTLREEGAFQAWLMRIVVNECKSLLRRQVRVIPVEEIDLGEDSPPPDPGVREALEKLPEKLRLPLVLHYVEGFPLSDISAMLGVPVGTLKWRLSQARGILKIELQDEKEACRA